MSQTGQSKRVKTENENGATHIPALRVAYEGKLSNELLDKCDEFSEKYYDTLKTGFNKVEENERLIKTILKELKATLNRCNDNTENYIEYLESLVNIKGNREFLLPFLDICTETKHHISPDIENRLQSHYFFPLGDAYEFLGIEHHA